MESVENGRERGHLPKLHRTRCSGSGRELLWVLVAQADNTPASAGLAIETIMQANYDNDLAENTLASSNTFYHEYCRYHQWLPSHQRLPNVVMAKKRRSHVVWRIGESASNLLDFEIALARATRQLASTLVAIRDLLGELEAREVTQNLSAASGRAMLTKRHDASTDVNNAAKKGDPKPTKKPKDFSAHWSARFGLFRHCGSKHWHQHCTKQNKNSTMAISQATPLTTTALFPPLPLGAKYFRLEAAGHYLIFSSR
eukprot:6196206-Pleurochrysis_carterae.AAC.4